MGLIDRDAALEALIEKGQTSRRYKLSEIWELNGQEIKEALNTIPSAQPKPQWIPCSERMPDAAQRVLLSGHGVVMIGMLHSFGKYSLEPTGISYVYSKDDIEAWMPLPEPYAQSEHEIEQCCNNCKWYCSMDDYCVSYHCNLDGREKHSCFEEE